MDIVTETIQKALEIGMPSITRIPSIESIIWTLLALSGGVLGYFYRPYWGVRKVPGPPTMPFVGHLPLLAKHGPDLFSILAKRYGPIYRFHMGRQPLVIIASPELCKEVGIKKFKDISNRSIPSPIAASPLHQKGLFFTRDSRWSIMRNTVVSIYQPSHLASLVPTMQAYITAISDNIESKKGEDFVFSDLSLRMASDVIGQAAFGVDFGLSKPKSWSVVGVKKDDDVQNFINQHIYSTSKLKMDFTGSFSIILGLIIPILQEPVRQIMKRIPFTMDWRFDRINKSLSTQLDGIVSKRMKERKKDSKNLLSLILKARESEATTRNIFTPDYITAVTFEHLLAGSTTTSFTLSSALYLISQDLEVERKLTEEIDSFGPHDQLPTAENLHNKFPYLDQVVKETMRFYLVSPLIARIASKDVEIGGYVLPKGTWIWLAPGVLAKDPKNFPEPERFKPERFDPEGDEEKQRHHYAHIPFGLGPRSCIGQKFSIQEIKLALIHLYRKFVFRHSPNMESPLEMEFGIVQNFKHGVKLRAIKREYKR